MFVLYRCTDYDGELEYKASSVIGIYDDYKKAKADLLKMMDKMKNKSEFFIECDNDNYFFASVIVNNTKKLCFEIQQKQFELNKLKLK